MRRSRHRLLPRALWLCSLSAAGCRDPGRAVGPAQPPAPTASVAGSGAVAASPPASASEVAPRPSGELVAGLAPSGSGSTGVSPSASAATGWLPARALDPPLLLDAAGAPLPQTEERPSVDSPWCSELGPALFRAIVADDVDAVLPHFFPVVAYEQVKAIAKPARDWEMRLVAHFRRDLHEYHLALGPDRERARFEALEVPESRAKFMKPGAEGNRLGYWRVLRSALKYRDANDRPRSFEVTSLISWRGEWYVVHLHGFE